MISTKIYNVWAKDPDAPELVISAVVEIGGGTVNYTFRVPAPKNELDPNKPVKVKRFRRKVIKVWQ